MSAYRLIACSSFLGHATHTTKGPRRYYTQHSSPIELHKYSSRGGRNLSERFRRLEKMLLAKHNLSRAIIDAPQPLTRTPPSTLRRPSTAKTFRGLVIPEVPKAPEPDECCMSGCAVCVHDLYQESLDAYRTSVASVRVSLTAMKVPVEQWPETIRPKPEGRTPLPASSVSLSAFEEMERALKVRHEAEAQS
ncbi:hypothetical protein BJV78DRAFT_1224578 [Lactifluus subvellereus]|nr:hypothetical protein BJV78DRAFT_1224578 [Lactifluus subvellereus]